MKTINKNITNEITIKNSKFITLLIKISSPNITNILEKINNDFPKATHYCYAYIYNEVKRFSDDGEPGGTAGMPILNVLEKENLNNILCVVVRYFGGIKLGAGGLVRAYTKAVTEALKSTSFFHLEKGYKVEIIFNYDEEKQINYILKNMTIIDKEYEENIHYIALITEDFIDKLYNYNYQVIEEIYIEKNIE